MTDIIIRKCNKKNKKTLVGKVENIEISKYPKIKNISEPEPIDFLQNMFPDVDKELISIIFESSNLSMNDSIKNLKEISISVKIEQTNNLIDLNNEIINENENEKQMILNIERKIGSLLSDIEESNDKLSIDKVSSDLLRSLKRLFGY